LSKNIINSLALLRELQHNLYEIARYAEADQPDSLDIIQRLSERSLRLIDSAILTAKLEMGQTQLITEPLALGSVMHDVSYSLRLLNGEPADVSNASHSLVNTSRELLTSLLFSAGAFVKNSVPGPLTIASYKDRDGVGVGVFAKQFNLTQVDYIRAIEHMESTVMPLSSHSSSSGVMLLLASRIADQLGSKLYVKKHGGHKGFAVVLPKNQQLSILSAG